MVHGAKDQTFSGPGQCPPRSFWREKARVQVPASALWSGVLGWVGQVGGGDRVELTWEGLAGLCPPGQSSATQIPEWGGGDVERVLQCARSRGRPAGGEPAARRGKPPLQGREGRSAWAPREKARWLPAAGSGSGSGSRADSG
jgi:hypothetical protein